LLQQNAAQINNIVKATFGEGHLQHGTEGICSDDLEDGEFLQCLWASSQSQISSASHDQKYGALMKVLFHSYHVDGAC
jgi:hypothetical protein